MTFWLPNFVHYRVRNLDIALSFVPQEVYNQAATLTVVPEPSTVGRIFILFGGLDIGDLESGGMHGRATGSVSLKRPRVLSPQTIATRFWSGLGT